MKRARAQCAAALACLAGTAALAAGPARADVPWAAAVPVQASPATVPAQKPAAKQPPAAAKRTASHRKAAAKPRSSSHPSRGSSRDNGTAARKRAAARRKAAARQRAAAKRRAAAKAAASRRAASEASAAPAPWWGGERPFAASSPWNAQLSGTASLAVDSAATVSKLVAMVGRYGPWIPTTQYGLPVYRVGAGQPVVPVIQDTKNRALTPAFAAVPLPPDAQPSQGTDKSLVVWQPSTDTMWEFWRLRKEADGQWHATWGGRIDHVSQSSGVLPNPYGTSASGMALIGGVLTPEEIVGGEIHHALAMGVPEVAPTFVAPATDTDGKTAGGIPLGTRFRLDPTLDVASLKLPRTVAIIATAAQRYGIYVRDTSGAVSLYAQDPVTLGSNPWPAIFDNQSPSKLLARFPWNRLQVVAP